MATIQTIDATIFASSHPDIAKRTSVSGVLISSVMLLVGILAFASTFELEDKMCIRDRFKAGDIGKYLTGFEVLNPELVICHLDSKSTMQIDITINKGRGYVPADENREYCTDVNVIPIDSIYTPIRNVKYAVENFRVEQKTDYEKLVPVSYTHL